MKSTLKETYYCDYSHPEIQNLAGKLSEQADDPVKIAKRTFYHVRDSIVTGYDLYRMKASDILKKGYGICWGKSTLLVALLRCNQIEAQFGTIPVHKKFIKPLIGNFYHLANSPYNHCIVHAFLNERWTILDPVLDKTTYEVFFAPENVPWGIDWNGEDDCRLYTESVVGQPMIHGDLDLTIEKKAGNTELPEFLAAGVNRFLNRRIWKKTHFFKHLHKDLS
ncbi:transglutaminase-like domain-containing protein [Desulfospira joergensenii]|uniref:transglutaminase-like domain-containing protein n=1 Tax=Desulfospira joergensenii TaxID=53329 RepID=UPI0006878735|nr:transglutaminase-like domain-containing protein [Desulfospira joergensenii]